MPMANYQIQPIKLFVRRLSTRPSIGLYKESMSSIGSQAMILTAGFHGDPIVSKFHGMTISSVSSLCIEPEPLLQFNLQVPSATSDLLHQFNSFAIHIMPPTIDSIRIARAFAQGTRIHRDSQGNLVHTKPFMSLSKDDWKLQNINDKVQIPIISHAERVFLCEKKDLFQVNNHELWVAQVNDILINQPRKSGGLLYFDRHFHNIGTKLEN
ncbi:BA75_04103T0 [Komagataella pastoris]|uniref:BA75_04103T0 n=1 Tax=Komagataella pastoris TaxID=4922 RepID=A0A1B2JEN2_PICPA|nr:BA75_04103T0 [Komagataella pastoris]